MNSFKPCEKVLRSSKVMEKIEAAERLKKREVKEKGAKNKKKPEKAKNKSVDYLPSSYICSLYV